MISMTSGKESFSNKRMKYERWNIHHRIVHIGIFTTFILCALTGLPIKFHHKGWSQAVAGFFGGGDGLLQWHLFAAVTLFLVCAYHLGYSILYAVIKKDFSMATRPTFKMGRDMIQNIKYYLGKAEEPPKFDRYTYKEFLDYWAVFWGMAIIGGSGLMMWLPEWTMRYFPRWILDSYRMGHSDEAVLAVLVIFIWHFYNVHFNPDFFPMSSTWWNGHMSQEVMEHEHGAELEKIMAKRELPVDSLRMTVVEGSEINTPGSK